MRNVLKTFALIIVLASGLSGQNNSCLSSPNLTKQCGDYSNALVIWNQTLRTQTTKIVGALDRLGNGSARLSTVAGVFRAAQSAEMAAFTRFTKQRVPAPLTWMKRQTDKMHWLFQLATSDLARAASRHSTSDLTRGNGYLFRLDALAKEFNEELAQYKEQLDNEKEQRQQSEAFLSEKARLSLKEGELYATARKVLLADGWTPMKNDNVDLEHNVVKNLGFIEMDTCSGTGVGYCNFTWWKEPDGPLLTITTVGNDETQGGEPTVSGYRID